MNHLIIMAGGVGSRFWPMSTAERPKQFIDVLGTGRSMLQLTVDRFKGIIREDNIWVVTSRKYRSIVREQLPFIDEDHVLLEPCMRNTAPCIAYVSYKIYARYPDANLVFSPADHIVIDTSQFQSQISKALKFTEKSSSIVTLGIRPSRPETGYGYIKAGFSANEIKPVESFREKPSLDIARQYLAEGNYFWNAGIFVWNVRTVIEELRNFVPELTCIFDSISSSFYTESEQEMIDERFPQCSNISIDYAVMEKSTNTFVLPSDFGWSDLGTWGSLYDLSEKTVEGNVTIGTGVKMIDCHECVVHISSDKSVVIQGLDNYIIAERNGNLLICQKEKEQSIKDWVSNS